MMLYPGIEPLIHGVYEDGRASADLDAVEKSLSPLHGMEPRFLGPNYYNDCAIPVQVVAN
jgi:hypothetical protein